MSEVQKHGLDFEKWIKETFFESFVQTPYTDKWDATSVVFKGKYQNYTGSFPGLPISIKTCKYGSSIGFGDAIRQFENKENFLLIVGFWQVNGEFKKFVSVKAIRIDREQWHRWFMEKEASSETLNIENYEKNLRSLDLGIKETAFYTDARDFAKQGKRNLPSGAISINPKIDSKDQRRLQCSISFRIFWNEIVRQYPFSHDNCIFWGEKVPLL